MPPLNIKPPSRSSTPTGPAAPRQQGAVARGVGLGVSGCSGCLTFIVLAVVVLLVIGSCASS